MNCTDVSVPFCFGKGGSVVLINCSLCGTEATLFYLAGPVCSSFSAKPCKLFPRLDSTNKTALFCLLLLRDSRHAFLFSILPSILLSLANLAGAIRLQWVPVTYFFRIITPPMSWLGEVGCSSHPLSHVVSIL